MTAYFKDCRYIEDVKETFRDLAKKLHPDNGGNAEMFKSMMAEYTAVFNRLKNRHRPANGEADTYCGHERKTVNESTEIPEAFAEIILKVIHMDGVQIEIIGSWVWLTGNTFVYKDTIKEAGFWYSKSKKAWYWTGRKETHKPRYRGRHTMNGLRQIWGSETVSTQAVPHLT